VAVVFILAGLLRTSGPVRATAEMEQSLESPHLIIRRPHYGFAKTLRDHGRRGIAPAFWSAPVL
ncbi:MAG: hypothetical protein L0Z50_02740, partial [Verrucomicrobiales bacterium]|nr:hypothetical protein [Verrucomicrobiales bacterium]